MYIRNSITTYNAIKSFTNVNNNNPAGDEYDVKCPLNACSHCKTMR